jgi:hypothetical protein
MQGFSFSRRPYSLPRGRRDRGVEDYLRTTPMPMVLTQLGATQSAPFGLERGALDATGAQAFHSDGMGAVVAR